MDIFYLFGKCRNHLAEGCENIINIYRPQVFSEKMQVQGIINFVLILVIMFCVVSILLDAVPKWIKVIKEKRPLIKET